MNKWKKVADFIDFTTKGITPKYVENSSIIVLNQKCIRNNRIDYSFSQYTDDTKQIAKTKFVERGDILMNSTGTGTAGRCAFVSEIPLNHRLITDSHILILRCGNYYEAQCLNYLLFSFEKELMSFMTGSSGQSELDKVVLMNLKAKIPTDLTTQKNIASLLSKLETKIALNNRINVELEAMAKTVYDYWFVQFDFPFDFALGKPSAEGKLYKSSGGKMVWSEGLKREVPEGWEVKSLDKTIETIIDNRGKTPLKLGGEWAPDKNGVVALSAKHVKGGKLIKLDEANVVTFEMFEKWMSSNKLQEGDILMTSEAPCGEFYLILNDTNYCLSQRLFAIRANQSIVKSNYLYYELSKGNGYSQILGKQAEVLFLE